MGVSHTHQEPHSSTDTTDMKVLLLLASVVALAWAGQDSPNCWCGMFIQERDDAHRVYALESGFFDSCDELDACKQLCASEFNNATGGGDLNFEQSNGYSIGQEICLYMSQHNGVTDIKEAVVYGYANLCNGPWVYDGESSINRLCCYQGFYIPCE